MEGLVVIDSISSKHTIEMKCSLIDEYVENSNARGTMTFKRSSIFYMEPRFLRVLSKM